MNGAPMGVGGVPQGPTHEEGGMPVLDPSTGQKEAEIEGGERIFSVEDTQQMDQYVAGLLTALEQDPEQAEVMAAELGMFVLEAIMKQEEAAGEEDVDPLAGDPAAMEQQQATAPGGGVPMFKSGGKIKGLGFSKTALSGETTVERLMKYI